MKQSFEAYKSKAITHVCIHALWEVMQVCIMYHDPCSFANQIHIRYTLGSHRLNLNQILPVPYLYIASIGLGSGIIAEEIKMNKPIHIA